MRKLKLQIQVSIDGYCGGPNGELDWMTWVWDEPLKKFVNDLNDNDGILLGRKMADGFITYWEQAKKNPEDPNYAFAPKMTDPPKYVFSKTLKANDPSVQAWPNTTLVTGDLAKEIAALKEQPGKDIMVYGGATFVSSLIDADLVDEYYIFINPVTLGNGKGITPFNGRKKYELVKSVAYECGIVVQHYQSAK
jgi:dihydrofolate reductase